MFRFILAARKAAHKSSLPTTALIDGTEGDQPAVVAADDDNDDDRQEEQDNDNEEYDDEEEGE